MLQLDYRDHRPLYEQIKEKTKALIISGVLKPHERIPSVRELAQTLTINPNTIQKAYKDLETEGFIYSIRAKGNFVAPLDSTIDTDRYTKLMNSFEKLVLEFKVLGISREHLIAVVRNSYQNKGERND